MARIELPQADELLEFSVGGKDYAVPYMADMPYDELLEVQERIRASENVDEAATAEALAFIEASAPGSTKGLTARQVAVLVPAWMDRGDEGEAGSSPE
jgi:hypothetical protein